MYIKISTKRDFDSTDANKVGELVRNMVSALTTANFNKNSLNSALVDVANSSITDNGNPGWALLTTTKATGDVVTGDYWAVGKGSKTVKIEIIKAETTPGDGKHGVAVSSSTHPATFEMYPGNDFVLVSGVGSSLIVSGKPGTVAAV
jgi:hypothetical protein